MFQESEIRGRVLGSEMWKRIRQNQDERYHALASPTDGEAGNRPKLYMDFKRVFGIPTERLHSN